MNTFEKIGIASMLLSSGLGGIHKNVGVLIGYMVFGYGLLIYKGK